LSDDDIRIMCHDIALSGDRGAAGFLLGALTAEYKLDLNAIRAFKDAADGLPLHFHMGWELTKDHSLTLEQMVDLGFHSARTTGGFGPAGTVAAGIENARRYCELANGRMDLFLGGGVNAGNVGMLVRETGIMHAHAGTGVRNPPTPAGVVVEDNVRQLRAALDDAVGQMPSG
jgi:copper homeostasis protein